MCFFLKSHEGNGKTKPKDMSKRNNDSCGWACKFDRCSRRQVSSWLQAKPKRTASRNRASDYLPTWAEHLCPHKNLHTDNCIVALFLISKTWHPSTDEWTNKLLYTYVSEMLPCTRTKQWIQENIWQNSKYIWNILLNIRNLPNNLYTLESTSWCPGKVTSSS